MTKRTSGPFSKLLTTMLAGYALVAGLALGTSSSLASDVLTTSDAPLPRIGKLKDAIEAGAGNSVIQNPTTPAALVAKKPRPRPTMQGRWDADLFVRGYYDDNILDYSQRDLDFFKSRIHLNKFSIETIDDWITDFGGSLGRRWGTRARGEYRLRLMANAHWYARNGIRNWFDYSTEGRWSRRRSTYIAHLGWTPHFYLRDLQVRDAPRQHPASLVYAPADYHAWSANGECRFELVLPLEQRFSGGWRHTDYSHVFNERDNTMWWGEYGWQVPMGANWTGSWSYRYASIRAMGRDRPANVADISRREHTLGIGIEYDRIHSPVGATLSAAYERQNFTSAKPTDLDHYGRHDNEWRITPEIRLNLNGGWRCRLFYQWTNDTSNNRQTSDFGAFDDTQFGFRVSHSW